MNNSRMTLNGKVAIVTGASSGIGRAIALLFASEGARVVVAARRRELLDGLVHEIETTGGAACALAGDVSDESFARALVNEAKSRFGGLDVAVNNAGVIGPMAATPEVTREAWDQTMATNLTSAFLGAKYQIPAMLERRTGSLIFVSSFVGYTAGMPGVATYAASKAGQIGLMKALAVEYGPQGIRVNAPLPGGTQTAAADMMADTEEMKAFVRNMHALKRIAAPEEQARAALFLASDAATFVTVSAMLVDGGVSISKTRATTLRTARAKRTKAERATEATTLIESTDLGWQISVRVRSVHSLRLGVNKVPARPLRHRAD